MPKSPELTAQLQEVASAPLVCVECKAESQGKARRWRAFLVNWPCDESEPLVSCYCPACASREFD
jgi:hypothetical protein